MLNATSIIEVTHNGKQSALTTCKSVAPLKLLNPRAPGNYCAVVLSSYGGGMVEGDDVTLKVRCKQDASLYLGTQAFTKVYKNPTGIPSKQTIIGTVETDGLTIALPDPVVPYAQSIFDQNQEWHLAPNACLVLADGHISGRLAYGEHFDYTSYTSNITIHIPNRPLLIERYHSAPSKLSPTHVGAFGSFNAVFNVFIAGTPGESKFTHLIDSLTQALKPLLQRSEQPPLQLSFASPKAELLIIRALARNVESLHPLYAALSDTIAHPKILGADPLARKY